MFSTETSGILCIVSLESYLGKPLNVIYEIEKKKIYILHQPKKLFCLYSALGIVTQERFHIMCFLSSVPGPSLHSPGCYQTIPCRVVLIPLWKELMYLILTVISPASDQSLTYPPHSYPLLFLQILFYFDIVFTVIFTIEIALKVKCPSSLPLLAHKLSSSLPFSVANTHACLFLGHAQYH